MTANAPQAAHDRRGCLLIAAIALLVAARVLWHLWFVATVWFDIQALQTPTAGKKTQTVRIVGALASGLPNPFAHVGGLDGLLNDPEPTDPAEMIRLLETLACALASSPSAATLPAELDARLITALANPRPTRAPPGSWTYDCETWFEQNEAIGDFLRALALVRAAAGDRAGALRAALGGVVLAHDVEQADPNGVPVFGFIEGSLLRSRGADNLLRILPHLRPTRADAQQLTALFGHLEPQIASLPAVLAHARGGLVANLARLAVKIDDGTVPTTVGRRLSGLRRCLDDPARFDGCFAHLFAPALAIAEPWKATARPQVQRWFNDTYLVFMMRPRSWGRQTLDYLLDPAVFVMETMVAQNSPDVGKLAAMSAQGRQRWRGTVVAFTCVAFIDEQRRPPASLDELQRWLATPTLPVADLFTDAPLEYAPTPLHLASLGDDGRSGTSDDLLFLPLPAPLPGLASWTDPAACVGATALVSRH